MAKPARVAIVADLLEERWPSMDLVAHMLVENLDDASASGLDIRLLRPMLPRTIVNKLAGPAGLDRYVRRFWSYPQWLRAEARRFDAFHVVDHSYAHVVHALAPERTVVTCHDTDAFLPIVAPQLTESRLPLWLVRRILSGLQNAEVVACPSMATRDELRRYGLIREDRLTVVPNGVHPAFNAEPDTGADAFIAGLLGADTGTIDLLHVGSCIPRKRIDRLLEIVATVRAREPRVRLLKAGGAFTPEQDALACTHGIADRIVSFPSLTPAQLAALYRRAALVVLPSDREGFGLPLVEALACGTAVLATDIPVFREVGGDAAHYCRADDEGGWCERVLELVAATGDAATREAGRARNIGWAARFSWQTHAAAMRQVYRQLALASGAP